MDFASFLDLESSLGDLVRWRSARQPAAARLRLGGTPCGPVRSSKAQADGLEGLGKGAFSRRFRGVFRSAVAGIHVLFG